MATDFDLSEKECARAVSRARWAARRIEAAEERIRSQRRSAGEAMRELRETAGTSAEDLAAWMGITPVELCEMEDGVRLYTAELACIAVTCLTDKPFDS